MQTETDLKVLQRKREEFEAREAKKNKADFITYMLNILTKPEVL